MTQPPPDALPFQDPLDKVIATPAPLGLRVWPAMAGAFLALLVGAAALLQVDIVVQAQGRLAAAAPPILLKPYQTARLTEVLVAPGAVVQAGQVLARLDPTFPAADRAMLLAEVDTAQAEVDRITAELAGDVMSVDSPEARLQAEVMAQRAALATAQRQSLVAEGTALRDALTAELANGAGLGQRLSIAREVEAMRVTLAARQSGSRLAEMDAEVQRLAAEADLRGHRARVETLTQQVRAAQARAEAFDLDLRRRLLEDLAQARPRLARLTEELAKASALSDRSEITAPRPGVVLAVAQASAGSLIGAGEAVVTLVPTDVPLIAEITLRSADVGRIAPGDEVWIKVDAFPWRRHGRLTGTLHEVSRASSTPQTGGPALHGARVTLPETDGLTDMPNGTALLPGMTLAAEIRTGTRSILDYFLDPLLSGLRESLREP